MKARVKSSGAIVTLERKQGEYYIDSNSNPYREEELDFDVPADAVPDFAGMSDISRMATMMFTNYKFNAAVSLAVAMISSGSSDKDAAIGAVNIINFFDKKL